MRRTSTLFLAGLLASALSAKAADKWDISKVDASKLPPAADKKDITFEADILPIFKASCLRCHGEERQRGDLRLDTLKAVLEGGKDGKMVVANDSAKSLLVAAVAQVSDEIAMPPKRGPGGRGKGPGRPPGGPDGPGAPPPGGPDGGPPPGGPGNGNPPPPPPGGPDAPPPGGPGGPPGPGGPRGTPPKPLTPAQVGLIRAWIDQGAK